MDAELKNTHRITVSDGIALCSTCGWVGSPERLSTEHLVEDQTIKVIESQTNPAVDEPFFQKVHDRRELMKYGAAGAAGILAAVVLSKVPPAEAFSNPPTGGAIAQGYVSLVPQAARPAGIPQGGIWLGTDNEPKMYDGTRDVFLRYPPYNAKTYGAKGDGVTDDTSAVQAAINAAAATGGEVFFPPGNYLITSALSITGLVRLTGHGSGFLNATNWGARIFTNTVGINLVNIALAGNDGNQAEGGGIDHLFLDGNSKASIGLNISGSNTTKLYFLHVEIINCTHLGVYASGNHSFHFYNSVFAINGSTLVTDGGVQIDGANTSQFWGCNSEANKGCGYIFTGGYNNCIFGGVIEGNHFHGVSGPSGAPQNIIISGIDFELNNQSSSANIYDVNIGVNAASGWYIENCRFSGTLVSNAIFCNGDRPIIVGGTFINKKVFFTGTTVSGLFVGDAVNNIDAAGPPVGGITIVNTSAQGMGTTTPAVPASNVVQTNTNAYPVIIYFLTVGTVTAVRVIDTYGRVQDITTALFAGMSVFLPAGGGIRITYTGAPTWKWWGL